MKLVFRETDGVTGNRLTLGDAAIPDGYFLKRSGKNIAGSIIHAIAQDEAPSTTTQGTFWLDTDAGGNGHLKIYANGGWRTVKEL